MCIVGHIVGMEMVSCSIIFPTILPRSVHQNVYLHITLSFQREPCRLSLKREAIMEPLYVFIWGGGGALNMEILECLKNIKVQVSFNFVLI